MDIYIFTYLGLNQGLLSSVNIYKMIKYYIQLHVVNRALQEFQKVGPELAKDAQ